MKDQIKVAVKKPECKQAYWQTIPNTLEGFQELVGGYIELVMLCSDMGIVCNEEGRLKGLPKNCTVGGYDFVGTIVFVGLDGESFSDYPDDNLGFLNRSIIGGEF